MIAVHFGRGTPRGRSNDAAVERTWRCLSTLLWIGLVPAGAIAMPVVVSELPVLFDGQPACAFNPEYSQDGRWVSYLEPLPVPGFEMRVRSLDPATGAFGPELPCPGGVPVSTFGRPVGWAEQNDGTPYFLYLDAPSQTIYRLLVRDGACVTEPLGGGTPFGPPPAGEVWRSIASYTEPGAAGRSYLTYIASDSPNLGLATWVEIRIAEHDDAGVVTSEVVVERQAWDLPCFNSLPCKLSFGGVLPLDKAYVRWVRESRPAALLYGSMPTPLEWGTRAEEFPPELDRVTFELPPENVSDDGFYPVSVFGYDAGRAAVAGFDDRKDSIAYALDPSTGDFEILEVVTTDATQSQIPDPARSRAVDFEPFLSDVTDGGVFQIGGQQYITGPSEIWLLSRQERRSMRISDASTHLELQHKLEPEVVPVGDGARNWVFYSAYAADETDPWNWSVNPVCHELWRLELAEVGDADGDGVADLQDNCPREANADQVDGDLDGAGDGCDCRPGNPLARRPEAVSGVRGDAGAAGETEWSWDLQPVSDSYRVSKGLLSGLEAWRYGACEPQSLSAPLYVDAAVPPLGDGFFYLVLGEDALCGVGSLGNGGPGLERLNVELGGCP